MVSGYEQSINVNGDSPLLQFNQYFGELMERSYQGQYDGIAIVCIGCERSTGDALGPLVGTKIAHLDKNCQDIKVWGTLKNPVHAQNLQQTLEIIQSKGAPFVIAIDASLGRKEQVGHVILREGSLRPGSGVGKDLPPVGQISIAGIVNIGGFMENAILQCTSLYVVHQMVNLISQGLHYHFYIRQKRDQQSKII